MNEQMWSLGLTGLTGVIIVGQRGTAISSGRPYPEQPGEACWVVERVVYYTQATPRCG